MRPYSSRFRQRPVRRRHRYAYVVLAGVAAVVALVAVLPPSSAIYSSERAPLPTGMNQNFLAQVEDCFIPVAAAYGYDLRITTGFRTLAEQQQIYDQGRLTDGTVISEAPPGHSLHNYGYAVDVADRMNGYNIDWQQLVKIGTYCHLESGGPGDLPHFEYRGGLSTDQFAAGLRPPPLTLPCAAMENRATSTPLTLKELNACGAPRF